MKPKMFQSKLSKKLFLKISLTTRKDDQVKSFEGCSALLVKMRKWAV